MLDGALTVGGEGTEHIRWVTIEDWRKMNADAWEKERGQLEVAQISPLVRNRGGESSMRPRLGLAEQRSR